MDALFESKRIWNLYRDDWEDSYDEFNYDEDDEFFMNYDGAPTYDRYSGSWAQDIEGYSDDEIDIIFDGDPSAYWNID